MTVYLADAFDDPLVVGVGGNWSSKAPTSGAQQPYNSGGALHLPWSGYPASTQVLSYATHPVGCARWTVETADLDTATIYGTQDFFGASFSVAGSNAIFRWQLRWEPATLGPPETAGTDTQVVVFPSWNTFFPPVSANGSGSPVAWDPDVHRWLRISEAGGVVVWERSVDGSSWTQVYTHTLNGAFVYEEDYQFRLGLRGGYSGSVFEWQIGSVLVQSNPDCGFQGWRVGRVGAGSTPW